METTQKAIKVDVHSHVFPREMLSVGGRGKLEIVSDSGDLAVLRVGDYRIPLRPDFLRPDSVRSDPQVRIADMDRKGIDVVGCMISASFYLYWAEPKLGIEFSRLQNDALARFCRASPDRLFFLPTLPLQDIGASLAEMERAIKELGGRGICLATDNIAGRELDDEAFWPIYEKAQEYDLPLFLHPYTAGLAEGGEERLAKYNMSAVAGFIHQETVAVATLMFGGVLDEFPSLKVVVAHGGGAVPYQWGRLEYAARRIPDVVAKRPLREYLRNFYFENLVHDLRAREFLVQFLGVDNVLVGDNYEGWDHANGFEFTEEMSLSEGDKQKIMGGNAVKLFKLG